jgi:hypothetical protein
MSVDRKGAKPAIHVGKELILLHGTKNANLAAADMSTGGDGTKGPCIVITGNVFLEADAGEFDLGDWQFGIIQVSNVMVYEFIFAGRTSTEGSVTVNLKSGFTKNPSLDAEPHSGGSIDESIFDANNLTMKRVTKPKTGFQISVTSNDHPAKLMEKRFQNRRTNSPNFIFSARRDEGFTTFFVARENERAPVQFLSRVDWHIIWHGTFKWSAAKVEPTVTMKDARLDVGPVRSDAPDAGSTDFQIAKARVGPTSNEQDNKATDDAFVRRLTTVCTQSETLPKDLPSDFYQ